MRTSIFTSLLALLALSACGLPDDAQLGGEDVSTDDATTADEAPLSVSYVDSADRTCGVVLRSLAQSRTSTGFDMHVVNGVSWFVWTGTLDVSTAALAGGAKPYVLYSSTASKGSWYKVTPYKVTGAPAGFQRYHFKLNNKTVESGITASAASMSSIQVVPYLLSESTHRAFDHNRVIDELSSYTLKNSNGWAVGEDTHACTTGGTRATVYFPKAGDPQLFGELKAGGALTVQYDVDRLPNCRNTHNGYPAWDTTAFVMFGPSNEVASASVRAFETIYGTPTNTVDSVPFNTVLPADATSVQLWFENASGAGSTCTDWDSLGGQNYQFTVQ